MCALNNLSHFDTFGYNDCEIIHPRFCQYWVLSPYLTILFSEQFQKKIIIFTGENWWTQIHVFLIRKGLTDMQNLDFEQNRPEQELMGLICSSRITHLPPDMWCPSKLCTELCNLIWELQLMMQAIFLLTLQQSWVGMNKYLSLVIGTNPWWSLRVQNVHGDLHIFFGVV